MLSSGSCVPRPKSGLVGHLLTFEQFLSHMREQARAQHRCGCLPVTATMC